MKPPRRWLTFRRSIVLIVAAVLALATAWFALRDAPHAPQGTAPSSRQEQMARASREMASRYRRCVLILPCDPSEYCGNACLAHISAGASQQERSRAADAHEQAAADFEHAAELHARFARELRQAALNPSQPPPSGTEEVETIDATLYDRYRCDSF